MFIILLLISMLITNPTLSMCQVADMNSVSYCENDSEGKCCMIKISHACYEIWCYEFDSCRWHHQDNQTLCF